MVTRLRCALTLALVAYARESYAQTAPPAPPPVPAWPAPPAETTPAPAVASAPVEVTVRGDRASTRNRNGATVATLSREDIQALPAGDSQVLSDVIATQAGVVRDVYGLELFHVHGLEYGISYCIDGIPIMYGAGESFADVVPTRLVESVSLITNGIPVEYGANGGVVELTTRRPSETPAGDAQVLYGSFNTVQPAVTYTQSFGKWDVLLGGNYLTTDYGLNAPQFTPIVHDAETAGAAFGKVDFRPSDHDHFELLTQWQAHSYQIPIDTTIEPLSDAPPGAVRATDAYGNAPPVFVPYGANPTEQEQDLLAAVSYLRSVGGDKLQISPYFRYSTIGLDCDPDGSLGPTADPDTTCTNLNRRVLHEGANASYAWDVAAHHHVKAGVLADDAQESLGFSLFTNHDSPGAGPNPSLTQSGSDDLNVFQGGAYLQDEITAGKATVAPGVRVDLENASYAGSSNVPDLLLVVPTLRVGFTYALTDHLMFHASGGYIGSNPQTLDVPIVAEAFGLTKSIPAADTLKAEKDEQADLGLTYRIPHRLKVNVTAWGRTSQDTIDWNPVSTSAVLVNYNWAQGRAVGVDLSADAVIDKYLTAFGNVSPQLAETEGVSSAQYLFTSSAVNYQGWSELDHTQFLTMSFGADLHDANAASHLSALVQYGSGLRTGPDFNENLPAHCTLNVTLRHKFDSAPLHPEVAIDVLNVLNEVTVLRIADGYFGSSYGPPRRVFLRLIVPFGGSERTASQERL
jgi:TonB dependent receptor/TonB-dependent Receptor Plug Domain